KVAIDQKRKRDEAGNSPASSRLAISASFQLVASTSKGFWDSPFFFLKKRSRVYLQRTVTFDSRPNRLSMILQG
ncbi:hypothetical protein, partial [Cohnella sp. GCM10012308]|uniref:hypothetical protein n=1 Tax=Cohnella sp. GCM10012308 TaxID=3317329 RepID=UPI003606CA10